MTAKTSAVVSSTDARARGIAHYGPIVARVLFGLIFFVFGLNGFLNFIPKPNSPMSPAAMGFVGGLMGTGYFFQFLKGTEVTIGVLLLANRYVPLALAIIAPIVLNIFAFHAFLAPSGVPLAIVVLLLEIYLAYVYRGAYRSMLHAKTAPTAAGDSTE